MAKSVTITTNERFARSYADRIILRQLCGTEGVLKLGELAEKLESEGLGLAAIRSLLGSNSERFAYHERRWVPAVRVVAKGKPVVEAARLALRAYGAPMEIDLLVREVARTHEAEPEEIGRSMRAVLERNPDFVQLPEDRVALAEWAFLMGSESVERAMALAGLDPAQVQQIAAKTAAVDWLDEAAVQAAAKKLAPVSIKALSAAAWMKLNPQDPYAPLLYDGRALYRAIVCTPGTVVGSDGVLYPAEQAKQWITAAVRLADKLAPTVEVEDVAPIEVQPEDVERMAAKILGSEETVTATRLLEEMYEITVGNKTFPDDLANVMTALKARSDVWWVGGDRFRRRDSAPEFIYEVPEPFQYPNTIGLFLNDEGESIDIELSDEGLSTSLRKLLTHPLAMDVLDEDPVPTPKVQQESLNLVLKSIHRELGTFPLCQIPTGWLSPEPRVQETIWIDPNGREIQAWVNHEARLIFGLIDWWFEQPIENGAVFTLSKTSKPNVFEFAWSDQPDPVVFISNQRMEELRSIQERSETLSTFEILVDVMGHWPKGAEFLTLLAEVNVVRRTKRRLLASLLSSYDCFYQRQGSPVWHFDSKKVEAGIDKSKKRFILKKEAHRL
ncbi:MAG: hypothetical protein N2109_03245 [Fimbriimonadales bacterium]|nr:hypothetical protein [Fimbriimonadales bacterium]